MKPRVARTALVLATLVMGAGAFWIWTLAHKIPVVQTAPLSAVQAAVPRETLLASPDGSFEPLDPTPGRLLAISEKPVSMPERLRALHGDQRAPDDSEQKALMAFVESQAVPPGLSLGSWHHLVNDIWNILAKTDSKAFETHLRKVAEKTSDPVIRDYALQHLAHNSANPSASAIRTLEDGIQSSDRTIAGTSLLGLAAISAKSNDPAEKESLQSRVREQAIRIARDETASTPSRLTALSLCVDLNESTILPEVRRLLADPTTEPQLLLVAVRALGTLGDESDQQLLETIRPRSQHPIIFQAIDRAASQLNSPKGI